VICSRCGDWVIPLFFEPHYPKGSGAGRPPIGLERMLRMYVAQQVLGLSDEGIEVNRPAFLRQSGTALRIARLELYR
jgi:hypothetical protein